MGNGTTQAEVLLFQTVGPMSIVLRNVAVPWVFYAFQCSLRFGVWLSFTLDLLLIVVPVVLTLTLLSDYIPLIVLTQTLFLLLFAIIIIFEHFMLKPRKRTYCAVFDQIIDDHRSATKFVTYMRLYGFLATAGAILSVDFSVFPRRFAKTSLYGRSVMDLGTATFVYCFAVVDVFREFPGRVKTVTPKQRYCSFKPSSSVVLIVLGIGRTILLRLARYPYQINEYGVHWNFFITLGMLRLVVDLLGRRFHLLLGIVIAFTYQYCLTKRNLQTHLLSDKIKRKDFLSMNREGVFSLFGYLSIYYLASALASFLFSKISRHSYQSAHIQFSSAEKRKRLKLWFYRFFQLLLLTAILFAMQKTAERLVGPPSRRIANVPYVLEMVVFHTIYMCGYLFIQLLQAWAAQMSEFLDYLNQAASEEGSTEPKVHCETRILMDTDGNPFEALRPCLVDSINQQGLAFFLLANVLTGLVNKAINTSAVKNHYHATAIITAYMFTCASAVHLLTRLRKTC